MSLFEATGAGEEALPPADPEEAALVARARAGDVAAWEALARRHQEPVFRLAYLILGDPDDAEDVAQEALIRAYYGLGRFDAARPLRPWLLRIAANLARNRRRSLGRYLGALQRFFQSEVADRAAAAPGLDRQEANRLRQAVGRLRPAAQDIVYLRYFLELSEAEAAEALSIPRGTAKSRLHRALADLRALIETDYPDLRDALGDG